MVAVSRGIRMVLVSMPPPKPLGDSSILYEFSDCENQELNLAIHRLTNLISAQNLSWVEEVIPGYTTILVIYNPIQVGYRAATEALSSLLPFTNGLENAPARLIEIPVQYGGSCGPDLEDVASHCQLSPDEVIRIHTSVDYLVYMMGFTPGFPYLGGMSDKIAAPRLPTPRQNVLAGSVGIAGRQTGIYPVDSPGGWRIIGKTELCLFDASKEDPCLIHPGDTVRFIADLRKM
jgi:KipI family sensor histidine kinase inhibitor